MSQEDCGWYGFDLDQTLATYSSGQYPAIGAPITPMVEKVKKFLAEGKRVRIMTARASSVYQTREQLHDQLLLIQLWCKEHIGQVLRVTCEKDFDMIRIYDDRAIQVEANTGKILGVDSDD